MARVTWGRLLQGAVEGVEEGSRSGHPREDPELEGKIQDKRLLPGVQADWFQAEKLGGRGGAGSG